ncbi:MAG: fasciclin domain-containing protein [Paludibacteraceae bacterium]|nr:fasciclin domain-containing protein [Paludibacteraceae bacterium]
MKYFRFTIIVFLLTFGLIACNESWEEHYQSKTTSVKSELNLYEYIKSKSEFSIFADMIQLSGFDKVLSSSQTYTVWVPNNKALQNFNLADTVAVTNIVKNHITRFLYSSAGLDFVPVNMLSKKIINFERHNNAFVFGSSKLVSDEVLAKNGIIHILDTFVPYSYNVWEFIGRTPGLDSLRAFLYAQSEYVFDEEASIEIGTNEFNQAIYDSVITFSNPILDKIGALYLEDSLYAAILPDNNAWNLIYNKVKQNFRVLPEAGGEALQKLYTQQAIVEDLVFRLPDLKTDITLADSLMATSGSVFKPSEYLFVNAKKHELSNGIAYVTDSLRFKASDAWQKNIRVEAETSEYGRTYDYSNLYLRSGAGSGFEVSKNRYLMVECTSPMTPGAVTFPIPNTLAGKYRIYCVFVPSNIVLASDTLRKYKVQFNVSYVSNSGKPVLNAAVSSTNKIITTAGAKAADFQTLPAEVTKMFVTEIDLSYCNILTKESTNSDITVKLKVSSSAKVTETVRFDRSMRIDYIVLEPVE